MIDQALLQRESRTSPKPPPGALLAGPKTILVHLQSDSTLQNRLENALSLARASGAHIQCLHVTPAEAYVAYESLGGLLIISDAIAAIDDRNASLQARVEMKLANEDVSWDFIHTTGSIVGSILSHAALADLIVTGREPRQAQVMGPSLGFLGDLISRSRTPVFIPSEDRDSIDPSAPAIIAWDGSHAAADAIRASISLLKMASAVHVVSVTQGPSAAFPGVLLLEYLSRHGIHAEMSVDPDGTDRSAHAYVAAVLMEKAALVGAATIVMGGYNHSRIGEYVFGGVTRTLLEGCTVPLVIAH